LAQQVPVVNDATCFEFSPIESKLLYGDNIRTDTENGPEAIGDAVHPCRQGGIVDIDRVLDLHCKYIHRIATTDHDTMFTAIARGSHDNVVDGARVDILTANGEHIIDSPINPAWEERVRSTSVG